MNEALQSIIEGAWEDRAALDPDTKGDVRLAVDAAIAALDSGEARTLTGYELGARVVDWSSR